MVHRPVSYVPGLYKIFDEILVNAADNKQRDPKMDSLKVIIDVEQNLISVYNNGDGVPVEIHQEEGVYVPELIFGHLLTSSNYDDTVKKTTGGRNGYGAKLTNIFSKEFVIETADGKRQKKYKQVFSNNMGNKSEPAITKCKESENWTKVSFRPDLAKFGMTHLEDDVVALMKKRVFDMAGCLGKTVKVELNGERIPVKSFLDYVNLYLQSASKNRTDPLPRIVEKPNERWEICVSLSEGQFQQVSFVNSIATIKGGTHVDYVTNQITNYVMNIVNKKNKNANLKAHTVKNHLWVFVNALIDNPAFDSQTKETLTIRQSSFGSKCELSEDFLKKVSKSGVVESLLSWADFKLSKDLKKTDGAKTHRITGITKLDDANEAGGRNSEKCTLILTEGDSAKNLAVAGIGVVGRDHYGVFPLRGKLLNVREASHKQIMENAEIQNIKRILGLQHGKVYDSVKSLRYGHLMIMTDQDHDGSHIKGLLINFIHTFWPSLLKIPSFLVEFITPIVKASHGTNKNKKVIAFYSIPEFESWKESLGDGAKNWTFKYYKGLGTSDSKEGREYFQDLEKHKKDFVWADDEDGDAIELAFSKKKIEARKNWLRQFEPGTYLDQKEKLIKYSDFVHKELILFSVADLQRSIPSMVDGLKPGQRKILFCAFKRNFVKEAKVAQFSGYVSEHSAYHHGETSLASTIIGMAQDYVGSNNINFFQPIGQYGSRNQGGKDHAHARYITTKLCDITRLLFCKDDDVLLDYLNDDGQSIEPIWYAPIIPTVLVNGSEGIGTGWSSSIPNYNPRDIIANVRRLLNGEQMVPMDPWYRGFKGTIEKSTTRDGTNSYNVCGVIEEINETTLRITELPIRRWTQDYKEFLEANMTGTEKIKDPFIKDFRDYNDDITVHFEVFLTEQMMIIAKQEGLLKKFKLTSTINTSNMHLFDPKGVIKKFDTPEQILEEFFHLRLGLYEKRKQVKLHNHEVELLKLENKVRFILGVVKKEIIVSNRKRAELLIELHDKGFTPFPKKVKPVAVGAEDDEVDVNVEDEENSEVIGGSKGVKAGDYEYLLSMAIGSLTLEKVQQLCAERDKLSGEVEELKRATPELLWLKDLDVLEKELDKEDKADAEYAEFRLTQKARAMGKAGLNAGKQAPKKNKKSTDVDAEYAPKVTKPKGGAGRKKAPPKESTTSAMVLEDEVDDDVVGELKDRLAAYNIESSPDHSETVDTEVPAVPTAKKKPTKRAAAKRKPPVSSVADISDDDEVIEDISDDDFDLEVIPEMGKKKTSKKAAAAKPPAPAKKRGQKSTIGQRLITEVLKPAESSGISPEKKVRKMRASPFNKKSGSILGRATGKGAEETSEETTGSATSIAEEMSELALAPRARPQRVNRTKTTYVLSDSESDEASEDSEFDEDASASE